MNSEFFSISRFRDYFRYELKKGAMRHMPSLLICLAIYLLLWVFLSVILKMVTPFPERENMFSILYLISVSTVSGAVYGEVNDARGGIGFILLPVSCFEKYLMMIIDCLVLWPVLNLLLLSGMDILLSLVGGDGWGYVGNVFPLKRNLVDILVDDVIPVVFIFTSFMFGNLIFRKMKYGLTVICIVLLGIIWVKWYSVMPSLAEIRTPIMVLGIIIMAVSGYFRLKQLKC